ncbi:MAG: heme-degrading domain-containing protein [Planctomycetes bacterium]|nr:heme-degrading domain-containing protein [Planctomycetota bacterium]
MDLDQLDRDIAEVELQERVLVFPKFAPRDALELGLQIIALATAGGVGVAIDIECGGQCLFHHAMAGTTSEHDSWIRRKRNTMRLTGTSSLQVFLRLARAGSNMAASYGVDPAEHAPGGGGFPIRVRGAGIVGYVVVSGLPHRDDHALVIGALRAFIPT